MQGAQHMFAWLAAGDYDRMPGLPAMPGGIGGPGLGGMAGGGIGGGTIGGDCKAANASSICRQPNSIGVADDIMPGGGGGLGPMPGRGGRGGRGAGGFGGFGRGGRAGRGVRCHLVPEAASPDCCG